MSASAPSWSFRPAAVAGARRRLADRYLTFLGVVLMGYAVAGKGFAYIGVPPLFIGEVALGLGLLALALRGERATLVPRAAMGVLAVLLPWAAVRVAMGYPRWGLDAVRDGMLVFYALFAFVAAGLVLAEPARLRWLVRNFGKVVWGLVIVGWPVHFVMRVFDVIPPWPWAGVPIIMTKPGDLLVFLAASLTYIVVGFQRPRLTLLVALIAGMLGLMVASRGGMLGCVLGLGLAALWKPRSARVGRVLYVGAALVLVGLAVGSAGFAVNNGSRDREVSVEQLWQNVMSVTGRSENSSLQGTAQWRLLWWEDILGYTFGGRYFLDGKGFGVNLANADGYQVDEDDALRSPHNSHLTVLARGGVPMFAVWLLAQALWLWAVARSAWRARRAGLDAWAGFYAVCGAFWLAAHVNASFDVYLEGPMGAVWFWAVFGLALAGTRLQRTHPDLLDDLRTIGAEPVEAPVWSWAAPEAPPAARPALP